jgi:hypothetical protein
MICDGVDDADAAWQLALAARDQDSKRKFADQVLPGVRSSVSEVSDTGSRSLRRPESAHPFRATIAGLRHSSTPRCYDAGEQSLEPD